MFAFLDRLPAWLWPQPARSVVRTFPNKWTPENCDILWGIMQDLLEEGRSRRAMEPTLTAAAIGFSGAATFGVYSLESHVPAVVVLITLSILLGLAIVHKIRAEHCRYTDCRREIYDMAPSLADFLDVNVSDLPYVYRAPSPGKGHRGSLLIVWTCIFLQIGVAVVYFSTEFRSSGDRPKSPPQSGSAINDARPLAVEPVLGMLAADDTQEDLLQAYPWLQPEDIQACLYLPAATWPSDL